MTDESKKRFGSGRRLGVRIPAVLGLLLFSFFFCIVAADALGMLEAGTEGSPDDPPPSASARLGASQPGEVVHVTGALAALVLGGSGLIALIGWPERSGSSYQVLGAMTGVLLTLPIVGDPDNYGGQAGWIDPVLLMLVVPSVIAAVLARPWRHWRSPGIARPRFLILAAIGAGPAAWHGVDQALMQRNTFPPTADPHHNAHWWAMAAFAFAVVLVMAAGGLPSTGSLFGPRLAGTAAIAVGSASLFAPSSASAVWPGWAVAALIWGLVGVWFAFPRAAQLGAAPDDPAP